jgi:L-fuconolactonase
LTSLVERGASGIRIQRHLFYHRDLDDPISTPLWQRAGDLRLTVDINTSHPEYGAVENRIREFPDTRFILDHCGYVSADLAPKENTVAPAVAMARYPNVYAKLTFLPLASKEAFPFRDVHGMVRELVDAFGPGRCLFGTNFPQAQYSPHVSYGQIVELFAEAIDLSPNEREWILGGTAAGLWRWE